MPDNGALTTIASVVSGFGVAMLFFRIERELRMQKKGEIVWIPYSDWLLIIATIISIILYSILPKIILGLPVAGCAAATIMVTGYLIGILAHYRLIFAGDRSGPRFNPEPPERVIVLVAGLLAVLTFLMVIVMF